MSDRERATEKSGIVVLLNCSKHVPWPGVCQYEYEIWQWCVLKFVIPNLKASDCSLGFVSNGTKPKATNQNLAKAIRLSNFSKRIAIHLRISSQKEFS